MKIYMDVCCFNRPFDDQSQDRVRFEANAVRIILERCETGEWTLAGSRIIEMELEQCSNIEKRENIWNLYLLAQSRLVVTAEVKARSLMFQDHGLKTLDSLHLALAEVHRQDVFLTTDDTLLKIAQRAGVHVKVANPVSWLMEVTQYGDQSDI